MRDLINGVRLCRRRGARPHDTGRGARPRLQPNQIPNSGPTLHGLRRRPQDHTQQGLVRMEEQ